MKETPEIPAPPPRPRFWRDFLGDLSWWDYLPIVALAFAAGANAVGGEYLLALMVAVMAALYLTSMSSSKLARKQTRARQDAEFEMMKLALTLAREAEAGGPYAEIRRTHAIRIMRTLTSVIEGSDGP